MNSDRALKHLKFASKKNRIVGIVVCSSLVLKNNGEKIIIIGDPSETDMPDRRHSGDLHA